MYKTLHIGETVIKGPTKPSDAAKEPTQGMDASKTMDELQKPKKEEKVDETDVPSNKTETILGVAIGQKVQLAIKQRIQETNYYCVPATVQMVLHSFGIDVSQENLAREMNTQPKTGTEYVDLAKTLNGYLFHKGLANEHESGYHIQTIARNDQDQAIARDFEKRVIEDIDTNYPVFVAVDTHTLYPEIPIANHMIIVTGYVLHKDKDQVAFYYAVDPYAPVQDPIYGGLKIFTSEALIKALIVNDEPAYLW